MEREGHWQDQLLVRLGLHPTIACTPIETLKRDIRLESKPRKDTAAMGILNSTDAASPFLLR
jgi:hypothetical protein